MWYFNRSNPTVGKVSLLAGSVQGFADGSGEAAKFNFPCGMCYDQRSQSLLVCDGNNHKLRRVEKNGTKEGKEGQKDNRVDGVKEIEEEEIEKIK